MDVSEPLLSWYAVERESRYEPFMDVGAATPGTAILGLQPSSSTIGSANRESALRF